MKIGRRCSRRGGQELVYIVFTIIAYERAAVAPAGAAWWFTNLSTMRYINVKVSDSSIMNTAKKGGVSTTFLISAKIFDCWCLIYDKN